MNIEKIRLVDINGRLISATTGNGNNIHIDVSGVPQGMYIVQVFSGHYVVAKRLMVLN